MFNTIKNIKNSIFFTIFFVIFIVAFSGKSFATNICIGETAVSATNISSIENIYCLNPATIINTDKILANLFFIPSKYEIKELNPIGSNIIYPLNSQLVIGASLDGTFNDLFKNYNLNFKMAYRINSAFSIGAGLTNSNLNIKNNSEFNSSDVSIGSLINLDSNICAGIGLSIGNNYDSSNVRFKNLYISSGIKNIENFSFDAGFNIGINDKTSFVFGAKYALIDEIDLRIAYKTQPNTLQFGIRLNILENISLTYLVDKNSNLGFSNFISLGFEL